MTTLSPHLSAHPPIPSTISTTLLSLADTLSSPSSSPEAITHAISLARAALEGTSRGLDHPSLSYQRGRADGLAAALTGATFASPESFRAVYPPAWLRAEAELWAGWAGR